jgi:hypothetical protein
MDELSSYLVNGKNLTVANRNNLSAVRQELEFQMSGEVSDESAQSIDLFSNHRSDKLKMRKGKKAEDAKAVLFKRLYGVKPDTFEKMKAILQAAFNELHKQGGKPPELTAEDKLYISLKYLREDRTAESIGAGYGAGRSAVCESIHWAEETPAKDKTFRPPDKKALREASSSIEYIVANVTESPINRPKKTKKSGIQAGKSVIR